MQDYSRDAQLLERLKSGDEQALGELADAYSGKIYQLAFRYLRNREDAEEVAQDVLFKVYRKVGEFRGDAALSSWIFRITFNAAMSRLRSTSYQRAQGEPLRPAQDCLPSAQGFSMSGRSWDLESRSRRNSNSWCTRGSASQRCPEPPRSSSSHPARLSDSPQRSACSRMRRSIFA